MSGQTITVYEGGVFQVTYTAPSGCKVSNYVEVPLSLESLMWVFPTGCYDECLREKNYIIGPKGVFDHHDWMLFGNSIQSGNNDFIFPLAIGNAGIELATIFETKFIYSLCYIFRLIRH